MTNLEEILLIARDTAQSFLGERPPEGAIYIGSRFEYNQWFKYWIGPDGTTYQESTREAEFKRQLKKDRSIETGPRCDTYF